MADPHRFLSKFEKEKRLMRGKKSLIQSLAACSVLALALDLFAVRPVLAIAMSDDISFEDIGAYVGQQLESLKVPGAALAIVEGDEIVHLRGFGRARPDGEARTAQTPFILGSLTKSFTALAVMQLVEAGEIELDAPIQHHLPWFQVADPQASAQMTVRHLLNQTSGLPQASGMVPLADFDGRPDATERQARTGNLRARPPGRLGL